MSKNRTSLNTIFGKRLVSSPQADTKWPLPTELVGIEIEVEDYRGDPYLVAPEWLTHNDMSLRNGVEFVTSGPVGGTALTEALDKFFTAGHSYSMSPRTSVHIHINASDNMSVEDLRNMLLVMYLIEPAVFRWADDNRKWCGYCSPLTDIPADRFLQILSSGDNNDIIRAAISGTSNADRYYGFNMAAFNRHGTLEFRYFPCTDNVERLKEWISFVMCVKRAAKQLSDTEGEQDTGTWLRGITSVESLNAFFQRYFPEVAGPLIEHIDTQDAIGRALDLVHSIHVDTTTHRRDRGSINYNNRALNKFLVATFPEVALARSAPSTGTASQVVDTYLSALRREREMAYSRGVSTTTIDLMIRQREQELARDMAQQPDWRHMPNLDMPTPTQRTRPATLPPTGATARLQTRPEDTEPLYYTLDEYTNAVRFGVNTPIRANTPARRTDSRTTHPAPAVTPAQRTAAQIIEDWNAQYRSAESFTRPNPFTTDSED